MEPGEKAGKVVRTVESGYQAHIVIYRTQLIGAYCLLDKIRLDPR